MSRLIDADKLLEELREYHPLSLSYGILSDIEYFPTAYDIDKVIEEAEHRIEFEFNWLRAILDEEGRITYGCLDIAEEGTKEIIKVIKAGEQE